jgi:hypothetical protein
VGADIFRKLHLLAAHHDSISLAEFGFADQLSFYSFELGGYPQDGFCCRFLPRIVGEVGFWERLCGWLKGFLFRKFLKLPFQRLRGFFLQWERTNLCLADFEGG